MPQTTYSLDMAAHIAGQVSENGRINGRFYSSEALPPGRILELDAGALRVPAATTLGAVIGASFYQPHLVPQSDGSNNLYRSGDSVPCMRTGEVWVEYSGTAPTVGASVNVMHSSTTATHRGKVTGSATSGSAGVEISAVEGLKCMAVDTTASLALVELNLPA
jgi:hypothetical protein